MAEAKTKKRAAPKRAKSSQKRKTAKSKTRAKTRSKPKAVASNGAGQVEAVRDTVEEKAKDARKAVAGAADKAGDVASKAGDVASKAKLPLLAGGAALAGAAGGIALARQGNRSRGIARAMRKPLIKLDADDVARAAKGVGRFSAQVGELATGVQRATESTNGNGNGHNRRSPVEVVLQGLTARR